MTRVRYDPAFFDGPEWEQLGADAVVLHDRACAYVVETLSDGFVSTGRALTLSPIVKNAKRTAKALVDAGIWRDVSGGYIVCETRDDLRHSDGRGDEQPSRAYVERERSRARERQEAYRRRNRGPNAEDNGKSAAVANAVTNGARHSTVQAGSGASLPAPDPGADGGPEAVCDHGDPNGRLRTRDGAPRCALCRRGDLKVVPT